MIIWQFRGDETMRSFGRIASIAVTLISFASIAGAADIRVLSVGAVQHAIQELATEFGNETGHKVTLTVAAPVVVTQKIKDGEVFDAVIVSEPAMDRLDKEGVVNPESRVPLAKTGIGVAVRAGAPLPDLSTPETFKQALLAAKSIVYGDPSLPNQSGEKVERILVQAGLLDPLKPRLKIMPGQAASQELIAKGEVEMGLYNVSEIPEDKGLAFAGPVPALLQVATSYEGALMSDGAVPEAARAFIRFLGSHEARAKWLAAKLEPAADR
jgi:molybdate transport system substrate-binding protein